MTVLSNFKTYGIAAGAVYTIGVVSGSSEPLNKDAKCELLELI
ncbi:hypothetical protein [Methanomethylovorans sp.]